MHILKLSQLGTYGQTLHLLLYLRWSLCFILCVDTQNKAKHNTEAAHSYSRMIMLFMFSRAKGGGFPKKGKPCTLFLVFSFSFAT